MFTASLRVGTTIVRSARVFMRYPSCHGALLGGSRGGVGHARSKRYTKAGGRFIGAMPSSVARKPSSAISFGPTGGRPR